MSDLNISWNEYHQSIELLAEKIGASQWEFNQIICVARGGLRIGDILSRIFHQPLAILAASSYGGEDHRERGQLTIGHQIAMTTKQLGDRVLLVDDLVDSGVTLQQIIVRLEKYHPEIRQLRTAVIWYKSGSIHIPEYYVSYLPDRPWIHQPFEKYENWDRDSSACASQIPSSSRLKNFLSNISGKSVELPVDISTNTQDTITNTG